MNRDLQVLSEELGLHPVWQRSLLQVMRDSAGFSVVPVVLEGALRMQSWVFFIR